MTIARLRVQLTGAGVVGPGLMTFYSRNLTPPLPASVKSFINGALASLVGNVTYDIPNGGDTIDEATGELVSTWTGTGGGTVTTTGTGIYTLGSGLALTWHTGAVYGGHRVVGRTFMVPVVLSTFGTDGRITSASASGWQSGAATLITANAGDLVIWSRPRKAGSGKNHDLPARAGAAFPISSVSVGNTPTSLRSRRV